MTDITEGEIAFKDTDILKLSGSGLRAIRKDMQIMFQDPYSSLNPRMMVNQIISEGLTIHKIGEGRRERETIVKGLLNKVGLNPDMMYRYPHEFSGGQRQRIGIARFLAVQPKFVVCDEVTSSLDVSVQAQVLNLLKKLQTEEGLSYLFITHNLSVVSYIADRVLVMYLGRVVEDSPVHELFNAPKHPYTNVLMLSFPQIGVPRDKLFYIEGDIPSPANPPKGCHFHPRCPKVMPICREEYPPQTHLSDIHTVKCWLYE